MRPRTSPGAPLRVLVVDDTPDQRDLLRMALERTGEFQVVAEAGNGHDAVGLAGRACPDLVLLDYAMPVMDGLEALPQIRERCPRATVIMLSGFGASELTGQALSGGADGYVQKGQSLGAMVSQVRTHVAQADARRRGTNRVPPSPRTPGDAEDHLEQAPFGFLQVRDGHVVRANREAGRLLRLLQEYSRAAGTHARGTGLGLFVVRALAEAQDGAVTYAPREPHGAVFTLRLPSSPA